MAFKTLSGFDITNVGANGLIQLGTDPYKNPAASDWNGLFGDFLAMARKSLLSGILAGGVCTVAGLTVTIPTGTAWLAGGQYWVSDSTTTKGVTDDATTYLWGCSDGQIRVETSGTTPPTGFDDNRSFVLLKCTAVLGVVTLDHSVQQRARKVSQSGRFRAENSSGIAPVADNIPFDGAATVPSGSQLGIFDKLTISGSLTIQGKVRIQ